MHVSRTRIARDIDLGNPNTNGTVGSTVLDRNARGKIQPQR
jgi:hypothetical protein